MKSEYRARVGIGFCYITLFHIKYVRLQVVTLLITCVITLYQELSCHIFLISLLVPFSLKALVGFLDVFLSPEMEDDISVWSSQHTMKRGAGSTFSVLGQESIDTYLVMDIEILKVQCVRLLVQKHSEMNLNLKNLKIEQFSRYVKDVFVFKYR